MNELVLMLNGLAAGAGAVDGVLGLTLDGRLLLELRLEGGRVEDVLSHHATLAAREARPGVVELRRLAADEVDADAVLRSCHANWRAYRLQGRERPQHLVLQGASGDYVPR